MQVLKSAARGLPRDGYLRAIARTSLDWDFARQSNLRHVGLGALVDEPAEIRLALGPSTDGDTPLNDLLALCVLVRKSRPAAVFEFGTFTGVATLHMAMNTPQETRITTVDLPPQTRRLAGGTEWERGIDDNIIGERFRATAFAARITQVYCDTMTLDVAPVAGKMDFVWVDACHEYDFVKNDSEKAFQMVKVGGVVAWHDYGRGYPGVSNYLRELAESRTVSWVDGTQVAFCDCSLR
jgi:hypothetical protein